MNQKTTLKKTDPLKKLREIIREEVSIAVKEAIVPILLEVVKDNKRVVEPVKPVNIPKEEVKQLFKQSNSTAPVGSVSNILEETRREMLRSAGLDNSDEFVTMLSANTTNMQSMFRENVATPYIEPEDTSGQVNKMLASAGKSMREEYVEINDVPDFSAIMSKMK